MTDEQDQQKEKEDVSKNTETSKDDGDKQEESSPIEQANSAAERLKTENDRKEQLIKKEQELAAYNKLGGKSSGAPQQEKPKEKTPDEYRAEVEDKLAKGELK